MRRSLFLCAVGVASACGKPSSPPDPVSTAAVSPSAGASAHPGDGVGSAKAAPIQSWQGSYKSVAATITFPKDVRWRVPDTSVGLGDGTMALTVDPETGRVRGTVDGPLGPATLDGLSSGGRLTASVARQDASDQGFIGTLAADFGDAGGQGTMNVSLGEASAVRTAAFQLSPARGAQPAPRSVRPAHPGSED
jgi:hypothetical protein